MFVDGGVALQGPELDDAAWTLRTPDLLLRPQQSKAATLAERQKGSPMNDRHPIDKPTNADDINSWALALRSGDVPQPAFDLAKRAFLDAIAVSLSDSRLDSTRLVMALTDELGTGRAVSSVIGHAMKTNVLAAALANGTAAHAELFDDNNEPMMSHPSASLVAAILSLGQARGCSGAWRCWPTSWVSRSMS